MSAEYPLDLNKQVINDYRAKHNIDASISDSGIISIIISDGNEHLLKAKFDKIEKNLLFGFGFAEDSIDNLQISHKYLSYENSTIDAQRSYLWQGIKNLANYFDISKDNRDITTVNERANDLNTEYKDIKADANVKIEAEVPSRTIIEGITDEQLQVMKNNIANNQKFKDLGLEFPDTKERIVLLDKILSDEKLYNNKNLMNNIGNILVYTNFAESVQTKLDVIDKYLSDEKLYNNINLMNNIGDILVYTDFAGEKEIALKVLSDEKLYNNINLMNNIGDILHYTSSSEAEEIALKVLSDEKLLDLKSIGDSLAKILSYTESHKKQGAKINNILSDDNLKLWFFKNLDEGHEIADLIFLSGTQKQKYKKTSSC